MDSDPVSAISPPCQRSVRFGLLVSSARGVSALHTDHPPTRKRAILLAVVVIVVLIILIGWAAYHAFFVVAEAVPS